MFAQLGEHIFQGLKTPSTASESHTTKYGIIARTNRKDAVQPTGEELAEITLTILYALDFCVPDEEIEALQKSRRDHEVLPYIKGDGTIVGNFVIKSIDTTITKASPTGATEKASVTITLLEYADAEAPTTKGTAVISNYTSGDLSPQSTPVVEPPATPVVSPANAITADLQEANGKIATMKSAVAQVKKGTADLKRGVRKVREAANDVQQLYQSAQTKIEVTKKIIDRASDLPSSLDEALRYADNLASLDDLADLSTLETGVEQLGNSATKLTANAAPVAAFSATREGGK